MVLTYLESCFGHMVYLVCKHAYYVATVVNSQYLIVLTLSQYHSIIAYNIIQLAQVTHLRIFAMWLNVR